MTLSIPLSVFSASPLCLRECRPVVWGSGSCIHVIHPCWCYRIPFVTSPRTDFQNGTLKVDFSLFWVGEGGFTDKLKRPLAVRKTQAVWTLRNMRPLKSQEVSYMTDIKNSAIKCVGVLLFFRSHKAALWPLGSGEERERRLKRTISLSLKSKQ